MASLIEELIASQAKRQAPQAVQSDIGGMVGMLSQGASAAQPNMNVASVMNQQAAPVQLPQAQNMGYGGGSGVGKSIIGELLGEYFTDRKINKALEADAVNNALSTEYLSKLPQGATPMERALYMMKGPTADLRKIGGDSLAEITKAEAKPWTESATAEMKNIMAEGEVPGSPGFQEKMRAVNNRYKEITPYQQEQLKTTRIGQDLEGKRYALETERQRIADDRYLTGLERQQKLDTIAQKQKTFDMADKFRDEYNTSPITEAYDLATRSSNALNSTWKNVNNATGAEDFAGIYTYMKMLDSMSTVMSGEFNQAQNISGLKGKAEAIVNNWKEGDKLPPQTRQEFKDSTKKLLESYKVEQDKHAVRYKELAVRAGVNPADVIGGYKTQAEIKNAAIAELKRRGVIK
jgi:hypothetical protein